MSDDGHRRRRYRDGVNLASLDLNLLVSLDALLQQRSHQHHDDEQHEHDVHERRHVDIGFDPAPGAANVH